MMAKRYIDSELFSETWYFELTTADKLFWVYLFCNCDHAGIWNGNIKLAEFVIGSKINLDAINKGTKRIIKVDESNYFIPSFLKFQYGKLNEKNNVHSSVIKRLQAKSLLKHLNGYVEITKDTGILVDDVLDPGQAQGRPLADPGQALGSSCPGAKDKDKDKAQDKELDNEERILIAVANHLKLKTTNTIDLNIPEGILTDKNTQALITWLENKPKARYRTVKGIQAMITQMDKLEDPAHAIETALANNWQGFVFDSTPKKQSKPDKNVNYNQY